jgi:hypothetical protein
MSMPTPSVIPVAMPSFSMYHSANSNMKEIAKFVHSSLFSKKKELQKNAIKTYYDSNAGM